MITPESQDGTRHLALQTQHFLFKAVLMFAKESGG